jgi:hypothetical protein
MKKLLLPLLAFLLCIAPSRAQTRTTSVSIAVNDAPDAQAWVNGTYTTALVASPGSSNGTSSPGPSGALDGSGNATFSLTSQNDITFPTGGVWQVTVCPAMGCAVASYSQLLPGVLGSTQSFTLTPPSFRENVNSGRPANAYRDSEVISSVLGSEYFNLTLSQLKNCTALPCASNWNAVGTGTGVSSVSGTTNQISVASGGTTPVVSLPSTVIFPSAATIPTLTSPSINGQKSVDGTTFTTVQGAITAAAGGVASVPSTYAGVDAPLGTQFNLNSPSSSTQTDKSIVQDYRYGAITTSFFNPQPSGQFSPGNFQIADGIIGNWTKTTLPGGSPNIILMGLQQNTYDGGNNYNAGTFTKSNYVTLAAYLNAYAQGQHIGMGSAVQGYSSGDDLAGSWSTTCYGGSNAPTDEGCEFADISVSQSGTAFTGTVASGGSTGSTSLTITPTAGGGTQGSGRYAILTSAGTITTGNVTTITGSTSVANTFTFSGVTLPTDTITTSSTNITAGGSQTIATAAATTGITANSTLVCVSDTSVFECVIPTAVTTNSITAVFRKPHIAGGTVSWGGLAGNLIALTADTFTNHLQFGFTVVTNDQRQAWPVIGCTTATSCKVWISIAGNYDTYSGMAKTSSGTNAYTIYQGAEVCSVQVGGTWSNTITLCPNNVAWTNGASIEIPLYPAQKTSLWNLQINRWWPDQNLTSGGKAGIAYNGVWGGLDTFFAIANNTPVSLYNSHGGNLANQFDTAFAFIGQSGYGLSFSNMPDTTLLNAGCPFGSSGVADCTQNNFFLGNVLRIGANGGQGYDQILHNTNPAAGQGSWRFSSLGGTTNVVFPPEEGAAAFGGSGAQDFPIETGFVTCTQANCATSATTFSNFQQPTNSSLMKADVSVVCTSAVASATVTLTITYTDPSNTVQTATTGTATCTTLGASSKASLAAPDNLFTAKGGTNVQYNVTVANAPQYQARVAIYQESTN